MLFVRDRQRTQRRFGAEFGGADHVDLVTYVEFQGALRQLAHSLLAVRRAQRAFWRLLLSPELTFRSLSQARRRVGGAQTLSPLTPESVDS